MFSKIEYRDVMLTIATIAVLIVLGIIAQGVLDRTMCR